MATTARSIRFRALEEGIDVLRAHLLPKVLNDTGTYPIEVHVRAAGFRVLVHAEFESFFEDRAWEVALASVQHLKKKSNASRVVLALLAFSGQKMEIAPDRLIPPAGTSEEVWNEKLSLGSKVAAALNAFKGAININHGVRERNILGLLLPVGIEPDAIDVAWLATVDSFGEARGTVAHRSFGAYRATQLPDPGTEIATVENILKGSRAIDDALNRLLP